MKYVVLTSKHHEGFCMFDSQYTDYKCTNTPAGRDLVREYVDAFRAEGLHIGFYYSLIDWHHPEFPIDNLHPRRDDPDAEEKSKGRDMKKYAEYMRNQVTELLTNYGKIDILWFDFSYSGNTNPNKPWMRGKGKDDWEAEELIATARRLQPGIIIDNRTEIEQDLWTPSSISRPRGCAMPRPASWSRGRPARPSRASWGYYRDEMTWKSPEMLIQMLINTVAVGGNLLMNVGPDVARISRLPRRGGSRGIRRLDEVQQPFDLRLHDGRARASRALPERLQVYAERGWFETVHSSVRVSVPVS